jgi:hypothetical protein
VTSRRAHRYFGWLVAVVFLAIGIERALRALAIAGGQDLPGLLFAGVLVQAIGALAAAAALFMASRIAIVGLALFAGGVLFQLGADVLVYQVRAVIEAVAIAAAAIGLAALGWLALDDAPRGLELQIPS